MSEINASDIILIGHNRLIPNRYLRKIPYHILQMMMLDTDRTSYSKPPKYSNYNAMTL
jgi:hypothetical protein